MSNFVFFDGIFYREEVRKQYVLRFCHYNLLWPNFSFLRQDKVKLICGDCEFFRNHCQNSKAKIITVYRSPKMLGLLFEEVEEEC